jgi:putative transposase
MGHTYVSSMVHYVFSTKHREKLITPELEARLWPYMGGIARENNMKAISIGGTDDHVHMLLSLPATISIAKAVQLIKGGSSKWVHDQFRQYCDFGWQEGYGAFTIGISQADDTITYIQKQKEHHRKTSFQDEFLKILTRHGIEYDERYIWD